MNHEVLRMENMTLEENGRKTLNNFNITLYKGKVLGLFSNHASVKDAIVKIIKGEVQAQSGRVYIDQKPYCPEIKSDSNNHKVAVIHSVNTLIETLSVSDNIFVIRKGFKHYLIENELLYTQSVLLMKTFGLAIDPKVLVFNLSGIERYMIEMIKAYALGATMIVLKDMSSYLSDAELDQMHGLVEQLQSKGIGFLMVDSDVSQLKKYSDQILVVKKGRNSWIFDKAEFSEKILKEYFFHDHIETLSAIPLDESNESTKVALQFMNVQSDCLNPINFKINKGEVLSLFDRDGQGIEEVVRILSGKQTKYDGEVRVEGKRYHVNHPWESLEHRLAFIAENPSETMLFKHFTAVENLCFPSSQKIPEFWIKPGYVASCIKEYEGYFEKGSLKKYTDELSIQELYKLCYCKWHMFNPAVVVCTKPFSSVDKSLKDISVKFIDILLQKGIAVLILTSNFSEVEIPCRKIVITTKECPL